MPLIATIACHTFAAGLPIAPNATPHDGRFDLTVLHDVSVPYLLRHAHRFYHGTHTTLDGVSTYRGRRLTVHALKARWSVWAEADGEPVDQLPPSIEVVPEALRVQY